LIHLDNVSNELLTKIYPNIGSSDHTKAKKYIQYIEKTYIGYSKTGISVSPLFSVKMWNHYDNDGEQQIQILIKQLTC
jgi:hypothetical protein